MSDLFNPPVTDEVLVGIRTHEGWGDPRVLGIINVTGGWTDSCQVTGDGKKLMFAYTRYDFVTWLQSATEVVTGPVRIEGQSDKFRNYAADLETAAAGGWASVPLSAMPNPPADSSYSATSPSLNAAQDIFAQSHWAPMGPAGIHGALKTDGVWGSTIELPYPINSYLADCYADNAFVTGTQSDFWLYFESKRADATALVGGSRSRIWRTHYSGGTFGDIELVPGMATYNSNDVQISMTPGNKLVVWTSTRDSGHGIYTARLNPALAIEDIRPIMTIEYAATHTGRVIALGEASIAVGPSYNVCYFLVGISLNAGGTSFMLKMCRIRQRNHARAHAFTTATEMSMHL